MYAAVFSVSIADCADIGLPPRSGVCAPRDAVVPLLVPRVVVRRERGDSVSEGQLPDYMDVQYYARFEHAGWHALLDWGDYREIPTKCGRVLSLWEGERVVEVGSGEQPVGLCAGCQDALLVQMPLL